MKPLFSFLFLILFILSCENKSETGPTEIYYGQDICEGCKMIISERDFSAQYILSGGKVKKFDDIGCMIHYIAEEEPERDKVFAIYVRDYNSKQWINSNDAHYVWSKNIKTPMGHGVVALKNKESAKDLALKIDGKTIENINELEIRILKQGG